MDRATVICHILMALDGKIDGQFFSAPETMPALRKYGEVLTEKVSDRYLAYLRGFGISYLFAGKETIDCALLLQKLKTLFGIDRVMIVCHPSTLFCGRVFL